MTRPLRCVDAPLFLKKYSNVFFYIFVEFPHQLNRNHLLWPDFARFDMNGARGCLNHGFGRASLNKLILHCFPHVPHPCPLPAAPLTIPIVHTKRQKPMLHSSRPAQSQHQKTWQSQGLNLTLRLRFILQHAVCSQTEFVVIAFDSKLWRLGMTLI